MAEHIRLGDPIVLGRCKRCGRRIVLKTPGQEYGPKCARKVAVSGVTGTPVETYRMGILV